MYTLKGDKAILIGIVNRGEGCARQNSVGIYARITYYLDWITTNAEAGECGKDRESKGNRIRNREKEWKFWKPKRRKRRRQFNRKSNSKSRGN